ncbi:MAG: hypothetical protein LUI39_00295 [Lachnospiraceae bacterium]|nr:hypothetical protein [Lachnospiraceae bacterium]MCD7761599.1 hypothetical protein [Lachnospiraceae bacterium]MCD7766915.1 hypothetical protein [Lachnospiraceae bacterium]
MKTDKERRRLLHDSLWELLFKYAALRDELSEILLSFQLMYEDIQNSMEGIQSEMDDLEEHLETCGLELQGFHVRSGFWDPLDVIVQNEQTGNTKAKIWDGSENVEMFDEFDDELPFD